MPKPELREPQCYGKSNRQILVEDARKVERDHGLEARIVPVVPRDVESYRGFRLNGRRNNNSFNQDRFRSEEVAI